MGKFLWVVELITSLISNAKNPIFPSSLQRCEMKNFCIGITILDPLDSRFQFPEFLFQFEDFL